jgi:hypothetical protein
MITSYPKPLKTKHSRHKSKHIKANYCYNCGKWGVIEKHHAFHGTANRKACDLFPEMQFDLCPDCHRGTNGVHGKNGRELDLELKCTAQCNFEVKYGHEAFMKLIGKNYL